MAAENENAGLEANAMTVEIDRDVTLTIKLTNSLTRAAHYIADVRGIRIVDAGHVELLLSDEGRAVIPGAVSIEPRFNRVDPGAEATLSLRLPTSVVSMAPTAPSGPEVVFERTEITPQTEIDVVIGWSDTPFYPDPREPGSRQQSTIAEWQTGSSRATFRPERPHR